MISVSDWFKTWMEKQTLNLLRKFTYDDIHESERVEGFGSINRASDAIVSGGTSLVLINTDKHWNKFITDKTNLRRTAKLQLGIGIKNTIARSGIARSAITASNLVSLESGSVISSGIFVPRGGEWLDILRGWGDDPEFSEALVDLPIRDKFAGVFEKKLGSGQSPLNYYDQDYNPADLVWSILTVHGGLDSSASSDNQDIDYDSWLNWKSACSDYNLALRAEFKGDDIRTALEKIRDITNSDIYVDGSGKVKFFRFVLGIPPTETQEFGTDDFKDFKRGLTSGKIKNYVKAYYGYDPSTQTWQGSYLAEDSASQNAYGKSSIIIEDTSVWHSTLASVGSYADRVLLVFRDPLEVVVFTSFMMGMITEVADIIRVTNAFYDYDEEYFRVFKINSLNLIDATVSLEAGYFQDVMEYFFLDHVFYGLLDQDYNPLF